MRLLPRKRSDDRADRGRDAPSAPPIPPPTPAEPAAPRPLTAVPLVRAGVIGWSVIGVLAGLVILAYVAGALRLVVIPVILALFPAALLAPVSEWLQRRNVPAAVASLLTLLLFIGVLAGAITLIVPQVQAEIPALTESVEQGVQDVQDYIEETQPFGLDMATIVERAQGLQDEIMSSGALQTGAIGAATVAAEFTTMLLLLLVVLFFYLKDGAQIAGWLRDLFPRRTRPDAQAIGERVWTTVGAYFRGQLTIALFDAVFIGVGLAILGVPLVLPLAVLVFIGGLFPIVGAVVAGSLAVLVALADAGFVTALITLAIVIGVQQVEGNVLAPLVLGKATELHPLAVILALTAGGVLLGVLGAFLAVPVAASAARGIGYVRDRAGDSRPASSAAG